MVKFINASCTTILLEFKKQLGEIVSLTALAEGADTIFAETAISLNVKIEIIIPFEDYLSDFNDSIAREKYLQLKNLALKEFNRCYYDNFLWILND